MLSCLPFCANFQTHFLSHLFFICGVCRRFNVAWGSKIAKTTFHLLFSELCDGIECPGQGEICALDKYHRAVCKCPTECPPDAPSSPVCGSDGVTYENECEMNMTACVIGDWIQVVNQGSCRRSKYTEL
jgi:hypothetical protein